MFFSALHVFVAELADRSFRADLPY